MSMLFVKVRYGVQRKPAPVRALGRNLKEPDQSYMMKDDDSRYSTYMTIDWSPSRPMDLPFACTWLISTYQAVRLVRPLFTAHFLQVLYADHLPIRWES